MGPAHSDDHSIKETKKKKKKKKKRSQRDAFIAGFDDCYWPGAGQWLTGNPAANPVRLQLNGQQPLPTSSSNVNMRQHTHTHTHTQNRWFRFLSLVFHSLANNGVGVSLRHRPTELTPPPPLPPVPAAAGAAEWPVLCLEIFRRCGSSETCQ